MRGLGENKKPPHQVGCGGQDPSGNFLGQVGGPHPLVMSGSSPMARTRLSERESVSSRAGAAGTAARWAAELMDQSLPQAPSFCQIFSLSAAPPRPVTRTDPGDPFRQI